jgi:hypothetical protein
VKPTHIAEVQTSAATIVQSSGPSAPLPNPFERTRAIMRTVAIVVTAIKTEITSPDLSSNLKLQRLAWTFATTIYVSETPEQEIIVLRLSCIVQFASMHSAEL